MKTQLLLILTLLCTLRPAWGVEFFARNLNSTNGLPEDNVRYLLQDERGFIWMGTPNGLYRYDGYFFNTYKHTEDGNTQLLSNNHINGLYALGGGLILVSQQGSKLSVFDIRKNLFVDMDDQRKQQLYAQCRQKTTDQQQVSRYRQIIEHGGNVINDNLGNNIILDNKGLIWYIDRKTGETIRMRVFDEDLFPLVSSKKYKVLTSPKTGLIYISTNGCGVTVYDRKTGTEQHIREASGLIPTDYVVDMCLDADDNVWLANEFQGVTCLSMTSHLVDQHLLNPQAKGLRDNQVYIMHWLADSTMMVANTLGDVYKTDSRLTIPSKPDYRNLDIHAVCQDKDHRLWIGTRQQGVMSGDRRWYKHDDNDPTSVSADNIYYLLCDREGRMWVAGEDTHLDLALRQPDGTYHFRHFFDKKFSARVLYQDRSGMIWVGTKNGLYCFRPEELLKAPAAYQQPLTGSDLNYSDVSCIYEDSRGTVWVGTAGSGVYVEVGDQKGREVLEHKTDLGLISQDVQSILEDQKGLMWFATKNGLTSYNPRTKEVRQHYNENSLLRNYYVENCATTLADGRLAFGSNAGILIYNPAEMAKVERHNQVEITDVLVNGAQVELQDELRLAHDENSLTIRFSAFVYKDATAVRYTYKLDGYDNEWSSPDIYSFATYKKLPPGNYTLRVRAYGPGLQADAEKTLTIVIARPWWKTWWAYLIYLTLATAIGLAVYRQLSVIYKLRRRISIEKQLTEYKLRFFTNISHEFRTPLTIIRGAMERIKSQPTIPAEMRQPVSNMDKSVDRMLRLINQLLEFRKMQNDKLRLALQETDVVKFLKDIYQNFRDIADNKSISYVFSTQEKSYMMYVDQSHLDKIVYNILSNAFKYTPSRGEVKFRVSFADDKMTIRIEDTGVGIPEERQPELFSRFMQSTFSNNSIGIGLNLTKALVEVHHGTISYAPNSPKGSIFTVEIPTDKSVYAAEDFLSEEHQLLEEPSENKVSDYRELAGEPLNDREVLIVEDDSDVIDYLRGVMQKYFVVHTAMDGVEALQQLETLHPALIVSDIMMPVMDGLEFTSRVRNDDGLKDIPIILLTAHTDDSKRLSAAEKGADAYITKPFDTQLFITTAVKLVQQRDMLKQQYMQKTADSKAAIPEIIVEERDKRLLDVMNMWLENHYRDPMLSVDDLAEAMGYRRSVFFKKVKALTGQTPADYIRTIRMNRAAELLRDETVTVAEVCYQVGINDPHYFGKVFKQQFGISPKKYQQGVHQEKKDVPV